MISGSPRMGFPLRLPLTLALSPPSGERESELTWPSSIPILNGWAMSSRSAWCSARPFSTAMGCFILIGHSLGARAVVSALHVLATRKMSERSSRIRDVHLLGGAVDIGDAEQWRIATDAIEGKCYNYYTDTKNDWILTWLYRAANLGLSTPIGLSSLPTSDYTKEKLISIDCSHEVDGHSGYHASLGRILQVEKTKLVRRSFWSWLFGQKTASLQINTARSPAPAARDSSTFR